VAGAAEAEAATLVASTLPDLIDDQASGELADHGVPAVAGLRTALACAQALRTGAGDPERLRGIAAAARAARSRDRETGSGGDGWVDEVEAKELLRRGGIAVPEGTVVATEDECAAAAAALGGPVALKVASPGLRHKRDVNGVRLGVRGGEDARAAYRGLVSSPAGPAGRVLVERMAPPGTELLIAARADAVVPTLVIGLGGKWVETLDDVAIVPLPADADRCRAALGSLRGAAQLTGERGGDPVDVAAAAKLASALGALLLESGLALLELNPVVVHREGCLALDAIGRRR
jgi:acyl-CoA synthetase (NDP forming)